MVRARQHRYSSQAMASYSLAGSQPPEMSAGVAARSVPPRGRLPADDPEALDAGALLPPPPPPQATAAIATTLTMENNLRYRVTLPSFRCSVSSLCMRGVQVPASFRSLPTGSWIERVS